MGRRSAQIEIRILHIGAVIWVRFAFGDARVVGAAACATLIDSAISMFRIILWVHLDLLPRWAISFHTLVFLQISWPGRRLSQNSRPLLRLRY